jgi:hypothetical protein
MNYEIYTIPIFDKQIKRLARKYPSIKNDLNEVVRILSKNPFEGKHLGNDFYKIRLAISSKGKGKSGGGRIITYVKIKNETIYLTTIYDKSEVSNITEKELEKILKSIEI